MRRGARRGRWRQLCGCHALECGAVDHSPTPLRGFDACIDNGLAVTMTPDRIRRPLASAAVAFVLSLSHRLVERDVAVREGRWADRRFGMGVARLRSAGGSAEIGRAS